MNLFVIIAFGSMVLLAVGIAYDTNGRDWTW